MRTILIKISCILMLSSCVTRKQVEGQLWFHDQLPSNICTQYPFLGQYGISRVLSCKEFPNKDRCSDGELDYEIVLPYCSKRITEFNAAEIKYVKEWLKALGKPK